MSEEAQRVQNPRVPRVHDSIDPAAFDRLWAELNRSAGRLATREVVEDAAAEAIAAGLLQDDCKLLDPDRLPWLVQVTLNRVRNYLKRLAPIASDEMEGQVDPRSMDWARNEVVREAVLRVHDLSDDGDRLTLKLLQLGHNFDEIAAYRQVSLRAVQRSAVRLGSVFRQVMSEE